MCNTFVHLFIKALMRNTLIIGSVLLIMFGLSGTAMAGEAISVRINAGSIQATALVPDVSSVVIRIAGPDDFFDEVRSSKGSVYWSNIGWLPDGLYHYDVYVTVDDAFDGDDKEDDSAQMYRESGRFNIKGGQLFDSVATGESEKSDLWQGVTRKLARFVGTVLNALVPAAQAADLTASSSVPTVFYNDTDDTGNDWTTAGYDAGTSSASWILRDLKPSLTSVFRVFSSANNNNSFLVDTSGDITMADGATFIDRSLDRLGVGTTTPEAELHIAKNTAAIRLDDGGTGIWEITENSNDLRFNDIASSVFNVLVLDGNTQNVGIGTSIPNEQVDVVKSGDSSRFQLTNYNNPNQPPQFVQRKARGTSGVPLAIQSSDNLGFFSFRGYNGSAFTGTRAAIAAQASQNWTSTANGTSIKFSTTRNGQTTPSVVMEITQDKKVKINGTTLNVPDYVFEKDYKLMPLEDLMAYIKKEKHLPNMASADEVQSKGLDLGGNQMDLLEKVEELTLYTLQQHEQLKEQKAKITTLQKENAELRNQIETRLLALENIVAGMGIPRHHHRAETQ